MWNLKGIKKVKGRLLLDKTKRIRVKKKLCKGKKWRMYIIKTYKSLGRSLKRIRTLKKEF